MRRRGVGIGRTRFRLAEIITECLDGVVCEPEDLRPAGGRQRNNTSIYDAYAWEIFATRNGLGFIAGSFDTMTSCVKAGKVKLNDGEILADWGVKNDPMWIIFDGVIYCQQCGDPITGESEILTGICTTCWAEE